MKKFCYQYCTLLLSAVSAALFFYACTHAVSRDVNPEFARYIAAFTYGNISSSSDIRIELTQDMPSVELNKELTEKLFDFSPAIKGKTFWTDSRTLRFVPDQGELKNGREYQAIFHLNRVMKVDKDFNDFQFFVNVPEQQFTAELQNFHPMRDNDLTFNAVDGSVKLADDAPAEKVAAMFSISGSKQARIRITPTARKNYYTFSIDSLERKKNPVTYRLRINGNAIDAKTDTTLKINLPAFSKDNFKVLDAAIVDFPSRYVAVTFSDPLWAQQDIFGLITLNGIEKYSYEIKENQLKIFLDSSQEDESGNSRTTLDLALSKELKNQQQLPLDDNYHFQLSWQGNKPAVELLSAGNILPNSKNLYFPFKAVNLWAVDLAVVKIFENNILGYMQVNNFGDDGELRRFGRLVMKKRIRLDQDPAMRLDRWNTFNLDLSKLFEQAPGAMYRISLKFNKQYSLYPRNGQIPAIPPEEHLATFSEITDEDLKTWDEPYAYYYDEYEYGDDWDWRQHDNPDNSSYYYGRDVTGYVLASNLGIVAKAGEDKKMQVAVTDILTTQPVSGAKVEVYNYQLQKIATADSDNSGFAVIDYSAAHSIPFALVVSKDKDKSYLKVTPNMALSTSAFDISGKEIPNGLNGYIYGERGVWRPGDSIYLTFILEDKEKTLPKDHPVTLDLYSPTSQLYYRQTQTAGTNGFYPFHFRTDEAAPTGVWQVQIKVGANVFRKSLQIESIKPNRLKIRLNTPEVLQAATSACQIALQAQWLHGAPASNLQAKVEMKLGRVDNPFKGYEDYNFTNPTGAFSTEDYTIFDGRLTYAGMATFSAKLPPAENAPGMLRARFTSRVFETGGDASFYIQSALYSPFATYVGIKMPKPKKQEVDYGYSPLETDKDHTINIVSLTPDGKPCYREVEVKIYKISWQWWWNNSETDLASYVNNTATQVVFDQTVKTIDGKGSAVFRVSSPQFGRYLVMAKDRQSGHAAGEVIYIDSPSGGFANRQTPEGMTMLSFNTDKTVYQPGETLTLTIPKSSNGRALISIENGSKIIQKQWVETSANDNTKHKFKVTEEMCPNFYIFATLLQPHAQENNSLPVRMYGVKNISVENKNTQLTPLINMPDQVRPEQNFSIVVAEKYRKPMTYTVSLVDEGLLDLTSFTTPNAWETFYARQWLGVRTWDMFDFVAGASAGKIAPLLSIGGSQELKPMDNKFNRFKPIVQHLGVFTLKAGETRKHSLKLPNYIGSLRVMVTAGNGEGAYGAAEKTVTVKNPLMVLSTLPRVAAPDEEILYPVNIFVDDGKIRQVEVNIQSKKGLLKAIEGNSQTLNFDHNGDTVVYFKLKASQTTGTETMTVKVQGGGFNSSETIDIELRNPNARRYLSTGALITAGSTNELELKIDNPQNDDILKLEISRMPAVNLNRNLTSLLEYPYGCTEQIVSKAFAALYSDNFARFSDSQTKLLKETVENVIAELSARQMSDGSFVLWQGDIYPNEWVTSYVGHFLLASKEKGYKIPEFMLAKWKEFQKKTAQVWSRNDIYHHSYAFSQSDLVQAYRLYSLAFANEAEMGAMNRMKERNSLSSQARWRLAAAYLLAGKPDAAQQLTASANPDIAPYATSNNSFGDNYRDMAMIMETYLLLNNTDKALALAYKLSEKLCSDYVSTQTTAFALMAMSQLAQKIATGRIDYEWMLNQTPQQTDNKGQQFKQITLQPSSPEVKVSFNNKGSGDLFVRLLASTQPLVVTQSQPEIAEGLKLYVTYTDLKGNQIDIAKLEQGTDFYADVVVQNISSENLSDIALSQAFASGWEIFNDRLFGASDNSNILYQDIRDCSVSTFFNLQAGYSKSVRIRLQAAYCGKFYLPPVQCSAMYKPQIQGLLGGKWVEVSKKY